MLMTGCSDGIDIETFDDSVSEEVPNSSISIEFGISDNKVLSGEVIQKRKKEITLEVSGDSIIGEGTIKVKVDDENMLTDIRYRLQFLFDLSKV